MWPRPNGQQNAMLKAIQVSRSALESKIGKVGLDVALLRQDLLNVVDRVSGTEGRFSDQDDKVHKLQGTVTRLSTSNRTLVDRMEDAENYTRRCNLHFVGFPERVGGSSPEKVLEQ